MLEINAKKRERREKQMLNKIWSNSLFKATVCLGAITVCEMLAMEGYKRLRKNGCTLEI